MLDVARVKAIIPRHLYRPCSFALSSNGQGTLSNLAVYSREFRDANLGLYQVLKFLRRSLDFI